MGYTTEFEGSFSITPKLTPEHKAYLDAFNETRRMKRMEVMAADFADPIRKAAGLPVGDEGAYFVGGGSLQGPGPGVVDHNEPPKGQPGLWCQWVPDEQGIAVIWDGGEKFYDYVEWLQYLLDHFLKPWGYTLNGEVTWVGEDRSDLGKIVVEDNVVTTLAGEIVYG